MKRVHRALYIDMAQRVLNIEGLEACFDKVGEGINVKGRHDFDATY
jgi:hypothetical protein